ncbi:MAG: D-alanyl-D-alanine carboxypeptidase/D-alanyl-D-alanine-endopeptidase [Comamonadaceae bacterium]|nr:MAG: D-alanyl-D-alanine carboxypeptidase/D-alanyl-D-alanine-endopeptidase [Comamonadaceae bacterium]
MRFPSIARRARSLRGFGPAMALALCGFCAPLAAQPVTSPKSPTLLPPAVEAALARAKVPREALSVVVIDAEGRQPARLSYRADVPSNPASVMKLVTTYAALDLLGPAFTWDTPVYLDAKPQGGSLQGNVYIKGQGDPKLVVERLWLLMKRLRAQGVQVIVGDIVLDRTAFQVPDHDAALFDGEPLRPYNASPDALLVNYKSVAMTFLPDPLTGVARVVYEPPLSPMQLQATVPLAAAGTECGDWRGALRAELADPARIAFLGLYPAACGERQWAVAPADPRGYAARAVEGMWRELGGKLTGSVRDGKVPVGLVPSFSTTSPALAEVVRDINKYSNNVMTQQVFLTLALQKNGLGTFEGARDVLGQWWRQRFGAAEMPVADNGAGLSREARISAQALARMLQTAWVSPLMPELMASLPIVGVDGTLRRTQNRATGSAHLKTGTLRDVSAMAGYVHGASGRRYVLVAIANHANAPAARPAIEALIDWTARDQ